jgi:hypothetical protein
MNDSVDPLSLEAQPEESLEPIVKERHIDFLLQEEFSVNPAFLRDFVKVAAQSFAETTARNNEPKLFIEAACQPGAQIKLVSVKHSVSDVYGEADLVVLYKLDGTNEHVAILIEDKIGAPFQDRQASRYKDRGDFGEKAGKWNHYWTCLVAPECYIKRRHGFDASVELEQIKRWFVSNDPGRARFKTEIIDRAIKKASIIGVKVVDPIVTAFRASHYEAFTGFFKDDPHAPEMRPPQNTWDGDVWFRINCSDLLPKGAYIHHKAPWGFVDLTFPNTDAQRMKKNPNIESTLETGMTIEQTVKSAAIRLHVSKIEDFRCFDDQRASVEEAFLAVRRLLNFYTRERSRLEPVLLGARTANNTLG